MISFTDWKCERNWKKPFPSENVPAQTPRHLYSVYIIKFLIDITRTNRNNLNVTTEKKTHPTKNKIYTGSREAVNPSSIFAWPTFSSMTRLQKSIENSSCFPYTRNFREQPSTPGNFAVARRCKGFGRRGCRRWVGLRLRVAFVCLGRVSWGFGIVCNAIPDRSCLSRNRVVGRCSGC